MPKLVLAKSGPLHHLLQPKTVPGDRFWQCLVAKSGSTLPKLVLAGTYLAAKTGLGGPILATKNGPTKPVLAARFGPLTKLKVFLRMVYSSMYYG